MASHDAMGVHHDCHGAGTDASGLSGLRPIDRERYFELLNVLPPQRWSLVSGRYEVFHLTELIDGEIALWAMQAGERHWEFRASCRLSNKQLEEIGNQALLAWP